MVIREIAGRIKARIAAEVSPVIKVSIGVGPNSYLAKTPSKMRKPDGLFFVAHADLPDVLHDLKLRDLNGIAGGMEARLHAAGSPLRTIAWSSANRTVIGFIGFECSCGEAKGFDH